MTSPRPNGPGGVKSLRAMFESSNPEPSASPELRGRSPTNSVRSSDSNSRPTSKVRASFISVEPFDPFAYAKMAENSGESVVAAPSDAANSSASHRRGSMSLDPHRDSDALDEMKKTVSDEAQERRNSVDVQETVPEQAVLTGPSNTPFPEINEDEAMGAFVNNSANTLHVSDPFGPTPLPTKENVHAAVDEAAEGLRLIELATPAKEGVASESPFASQPSTSIQPAEDATKDEPAEDAKDDAAPMGTAASASDKVVSAVEDADAKLKPSDPKEESAVSGGEALPPPNETLQPLSANTAKPAPEVTEPAVEQKIEAQPVEAKANGSSEPEKAQLLPLEKPESNKASPGKPKPSGAKSPIPPKTPTSPVASPKFTASRSATKEPSKKASRTSLRSATSAGPKPRASSRPAATAADRKRDVTHTSPSFTKPRPKSPTRPAKLPAHLTQPTAASAAKREADAAKAAASSSGVKRAPSTTTPRAPAVASKSTANKPAVTAPAKKPASRPSLPAQSTQPKRPESRTSRASAAPKAADDGFLARMMRPTASSASKTLDKKDEAKSPPRRTPSVKPKQANGDSAVTKAKKKVIDGIDKAKEKIEGTKEDTAEKAEENEETPTGRAETAAAKPTLEPAAEIEEKVEEAPVEEATAAPEERKADEGNSTPQGAETPAPSGETMTQTPAGLEGGVIR